MTEVSISVLKKKLIWYIKLQPVTDPTTFALNDTSNSTDWRLRCAVTFLNDQICDFYLVGDKTSNLNGKSHIDRGGGGGLLI